MKKFNVDQIRNVVLLGHGGSGKTMLAEALLFAAKATDRFGKVDDGNSILDYDPEEIKRKISISTAVGPFEYSGRKINLLDTPGFFDFVGEAKSAIKAADVGCITVCAVSGVEVGTEKAWDYVEENQLPRFLVINKMDRENANFQNTVNALRTKFGGRLIPLQIPIGSAEKLQGVIDILTEKAFVVEGNKVIEKAIPESFQDEVAEYQMMLAEIVAETDDDLLIKYLDGQELTKEEMMAGVKRGLKEQKVVPILTLSAIKQVAITQLLEFMLDYLPDPGSLGEKVGEHPVTNAEESRQPSDSESFSAIVFKTMADPFVGKLSMMRVLSGVIKSDSHVFNSNRGVMERIGQLFVMKGKHQEPVSQLCAGDIGAVAKLQETFTGHTLCAKDHPITYPLIDLPRPKLSLAVTPKTKGDEDKLGNGLTRLTEEDPTFALLKDTVTHEMIVSGMGELHLEVNVSKLHKKFGVDVLLKAPKISYKETIKGQAKIEGKHKKQSGGRGQYGHVWLELHGKEKGTGFEFVDKIFGGAVPRNYIPAVEKGIIETMEHGVLAGFPVVDVQAVLLDGSYHPVDSSEMAFKIAASLAFKKGFVEAKPILLEPVISIEVRVPEDYMGDIIGDLNKKRGKILGMDKAGKFQLIKALAPQAELARYAIELRSMTQGRGDFDADFDHYDEVPSHLAEIIITEAKKHMAEALEN